MRRLIDSLLHQRLQHNHPLQHLHEDSTDLIAFLLEWTNYILCQTLMCSTPRTNLLMSRVRSLPYPLKSMIFPLTRVQIQSPTSSRPLTISIKKGEKILMRSLHSQGEHSLGLRNIGSFRRFTFIYFSFYNCRFIVFTILA